MMAQIVDKYFSVVLLKLTATLSNKMKYLLKNAKLRDTKNKAIEKEPERKTSYSICS